MPFTLKYGFVTSRKKASVFILELTISIFLTFIDVIRLHDGHKSCGDQLGLLVRDRERIL